jgi:hypothetical protein
MSSEEELLQTELTEDQKRSQKEVNDSYWSFVKHQFKKVVLNASGENNTSLNVFFAGSGTLHPTGLPQGAGVRCVTTSLKRLYTAGASGGAVSRPGMADLSISARSAARAVPISAGDTRHYFNVYRDPAAAGPCGDTASTVNTTNTGSIAWCL